MEIPTLMIFSSTKLYHIENQNLPSHIFLTNWNDSQFQRQQRKSKRPERLHQQRGLPPLQRWGNKAQAAGDKDAEVRSGLQIENIIVTFAAFFGKEKESNMPKFKYQDEIDIAISQGCVLPVLHEPGGMMAYSLSLIMNIRTISSLHWK